MASLVRLLRRRRKPKERQDKYKIVVLDFDGTIADTFPVIIDIFHGITRRKVALDADEQNLFRRVAFGQVKGREILRHATALHIDYWRIPFLFVLTRELLKGRMDRVRPMPGMHEAIKILHEKGFTVLILSANSERNIRKFLKHEHLNSYVDGVYGSVRVGRKAKRLRQLMQADIVHPKDTCCVGDEGRDIAAANVAGLKSIAVTWGYNSEEQLVEQRPTHVVKTASQLLEILGA